MKEKCQQNENFDVISTESIKYFLKNSLKGINIKVFDTINSTNTYLKELAQNGEKENTVIIASHQTEGRGRLGRQFFSPNDSGIYMSILVRPKIEARETLFITTSTAVAVAEAIEEIFNKKAEIKWVNDIYVEKKKVCGILTEGSLDFESGGLEYAVVGIGINVYEPNNGFPSEISDVAGFIIKTKGKNQKSKLIAEILNRFFELSENLTDKRYLERYKQKSFLIGKTVSVLKDGEEKKALVLGIDDNANIVLEFENKEVMALSTGEVKISPIF